jgi:Protein of unknown function (DUF1656)
MTHGFSELVVGGVFFAPFVAYVVVVLVLSLVFRPILRSLRVAGLFSHPSIAGLSFFVIVLGLLTVFF